MIDVTHTPNKGICDTSESKISIAHSFIKCIHF
nr:MAG TPA: hypothetical protein [Caudoviricetes sp.]